MFTTHARWYVYSSVMFVGVLTVDACLSVCLCVCLLMRLLLNRLSYHSQSFYASTIRSEAREFENGCIPMHCGVRWRFNVSDIPTVYKNSAQKYLVDIVCWV